MFLANWPLFALVGSALGLATGLIAFIVATLGKRPKLKLAALGLVLVCGMTVLMSVNSTYWKKPECYLPNGNLDESREECRLF
ncbi:MAG: hypothetical protein AB8B97_27190 [Granulosicoccus sp.]